MCECHGSFELEMISRIRPNPFDPDEKTMKGCQCEEECEHPKRSYNEWVQIIKDMSSFKN